MVKRFAERFQLWMSDVADEFEDKCTGWLLLVAILCVIRSGYTLFTTHHLSLDSLLSTTLFIAFVGLYVREARWTWIPLMILVVSFATYIPFYRTLIFRPGHLGGKIFAATFWFIFTGAGFVFSLTLRKRFAHSTRTI
jgi:hypothetical protein